MEFDALYNPYPSRRAPNYARNGIVATSQPLAAQAGLRIMQQGGNAVDAAVATAACLTVVQPTSNGLGSDAFAIAYVDGELHGLNCSGPAPARISIDAVRRKGHNDMPAMGPAPVTVPGAPAAWVELVRRFGKLPLKDVLAPAIEYAEKGYPIAPFLAWSWRNSFERYRDILKDWYFEEWFKTFTVHGQPPRCGQLWCSPDHAATLTSIAETNGRSFYQGKLAEAVDRFMQKCGGYLRGEDLGDFSPQWIEPISLNYRGYDVWEMPPNGQGLVALMALNILQEFSFAAKDTVETYHRQIEALKIAFADGLKYITDPEYMDVAVQDLLTPEYADSRRQLIGDTALMPEPGSPPSGGTVYLCSADGDGNMVSFIQSNYMGFGSGLVVPGTGISLQNRGHTFSLDPEHANALAPGKRTYHTIIPGFLTRDGESVGPFGVMGGFMQPQGHLQILMNTIDFGLNPQAALDAPRWQWAEGTKVRVEPGLPGHLAEALSRRGHDIEVSVGTGAFGFGQIIWMSSDGVLIGATEPRADGNVVAW